MPEATVTPLDGHRARARQWLAPIPGAAPAGVAARLDAPYQALTAEVGKLDAPTGGAIDWKTVAASAGELLRTRTKDLTLAAYLARALAATEGFGGLAVGLGVFTGLLEEFWEGAFPELKRLRGRVNASQWLVEKAQAAIATTPVKAQDLAALEALDAEARRFAEQLRARLDSAAPALNPLLEEIEKARAAAQQAQPVQAPAAPVPVAQAQPSAASTAPAATAAEPTSTASAPVAAPPPAFQPPAATAAPAAVDGAVDYLRETGTALAGLGATLRRADAADPTGYRILRTGLWLHIAAAPPATGGKTGAPPPPENLRNALGLMVQNQRWAALLEEAESAIQQYRLWLDPHRLTVQALTALGPGHARAAEAVQIDLRGLLGRLPGLVSLSFADGTPFADVQTRSWIQEALTPRTTARGGGGAAADNDDDAIPADALSQARGQLAAGQVAEGLGALHALVLARPPGRPRFRARLALAQAAVAAGLQAVALATYEELDRESVGHGLDGWEPALSAECLKGLVTAARALSQDPRGASSALASQYQRLCRLDPAAAHEVWP